MSHTSRRRFAQSLAAAAAVMPLTALAETREASPALAKALTELVRAEYGKHLDAAELARIEKDFANAAPALERLRAFPLGNEDSLP